MTIGCLSGDIALPILIEGSSGLHSGISERYVAVPCRAEDFVEPGNLLFDIAPGLILDHCREKFLSGTKSGERHTQAVDAFGIT
jgi:hypothetical protein